jgi:hypothetical protein
MKNTNYKILFNYQSHYVVQNGLGDIEVINELGDKFLIRLDDSKTNGPRRMVPMTFEEQIKYSIEYIDWITLKNKNRN